MGNGFKRFIDFSPLSVKCLNDQLEQLWLKVMGGISYRDLDSGTQEIIQSKADEEDVMSIIEQSKDEILLAVGSPGGDNLIKNGNWEFGTESWNCNSASLLDGFMHINTGDIVQEGIKIEAGKEYTFGFEGYGNTPSAAGVYGLYSPLDTSPTLIAQIAMPTDTFSDKHRVSFTVPEGMVQGYVKIETTGSFYVKKIFLREGNGVEEYTTNPNEMSGSGLSITENGVNISTSNFNLDIKDEEGKVATVLSADGTGFSDLRCSSLSIDNRPYIGPGSKHYYVNSETGNDSNEGTSTYYPFKTIARAMKEIPYHITGTATIHLSGGTYNENINFNYGGSGVINIYGESAVLNGYVYMYCTGYNIIINNLKIFTKRSYCVYGYGNSGYAELSKCLLDCNSITSAKGVSITHGFKLYIKNCEVNNCVTALYLTRSSYMDIVDCKGENNTKCLSVNDMAIANVEGTVPYGTTITEELTGGRIDGFLVSGVVGTDYLAPRDSIKSTTYSATAKFSYNGSTMEDDVLKQGNGYGAFLVFDTASIATKMTGVTIKSVKLSAKRRGDDGLTHDAVMKAFCHNLSSSAEPFSYVEGYGDVCTIKRGEEVSIDIPVSIIEKFIAGTAKGILFYDDSGTKEYYYELDNSFTCKLEVQYV